MCSIQFIFNMNIVLSRKFLFSIDNPNVFGVILRFIYHFDVVVDDLLAIDLFFSDEIGSKHNRFT